MAFRPRVVHEMTSLLSLEIFADARVSFKAKVTAAGDGDEQEEFKFPPGDPFGVFVT